MANLVIEVPDDLVRRLEGIASAQHKTVQQLAIERLSSLAAEPRAGSPSAILRVMHAPPHLTSADVDDLDAAIDAGRLAGSTGDLF